MIRIDRPPTEPPELEIERDKHLPAFRSNIVANQTFAPDTITGYDSARQPLYHAQYQKCCYCEKSIEESDQAVEHYRPKSIYWWLSWDWKNLLFVCAQCNRHKLNRFPLLSGTQLIDPNSPPGTEDPALLDPADPMDDPTNHIEFKETPGGWVPFPRNGSPKGQETIKTCKLDRIALSDLYKKHVHFVLKAVSAIQEAIAKKQRKKIQSVWQEQTLPLLSCSQPFTALSRDILTHHFSEDVRKKYSLSLDIQPPLR